MCICMKMMAFIDISPYLMIRMTKQLYRYSVRIIDSGILDQFIYIM